jgi:NAD(P)-dependent dehydrogenase (short-subunit alcohol dehydrogenase family)
MRTVVIGGTAGMGLEVARHRAALGDEVVLTGRSATRAKEVAASIGESARGIPLELAEPHSIGEALADVGPVDRLVLAAIDRDANSIADYDIDRATRLATIKLIGYAEVIHALRPGMGKGTSIVLFGGRAKDRPYPGSLTVSTVNGAVTGMVNALVHELAPIRVNAIHPGIVGDSPFWAGKPEGVLEGYRSRTPTGRLATMADIVGAVDFLLENGSVNAVNLYVDGGWLVL